MKITLEQVYGWFRGSEATKVDGVYRMVGVANVSQSRGVLGRWLPARPEPLGGLSGLCLRCKLAWGVLVGRYDAFDWSINDEVAK